MRKIDPSIRPKDVEKTDQVNSQQIPVDEDLFKEERFLNNERM